MRKILVIFMLALSLMLMISCGKTETINTEFINGVEYDIYSNGYYEGTFTTHYNPQYRGDLFCINKQVEYWGYNCWDVEGLEIVIHTEGEE